MNSPQGYLRTYRRLRRGGATRRSVVLYPARRRGRRPHNRLDVKGAGTLVSPVEEPLLTMFHETWVDGRYRPPGWTARPGGVVVDVGACVGVFTLWAARRAGAGRIIAIEPTPSLAQALADNVVRNRLESVTVREAALGGCHRRATIFRRGEQAMNTLFRTDTFNSDFVPVAEVEVLTLDEIFDQCAIDACELLKLDCEGAEYEILAGASTGTLRKVRAIVAEYHVGLNAGDPGSLGKTLEHAGFSVTIYPMIDEEGGHLHAVRAR